MQLTSHPCAILFLHYFSSSLYFLIVVHSKYVTLLLICLIPLSHTQEMFCDVTLACDGVLFPVHRLVLAMCSEFFNEILTKVPCQQPMIVLVPTVGATDLEALLTYIYEGEIRISQANLPSLMKAAHILKIKGLCSTNNGIPWEQYVNHTENGETSAETHILPDTVEGRESDSHDSIIFVPPYCSPEPEKTAQEPQHISQVQDSVPTFPQVWKFVVIF